jgi:hypothetical protein
VITSKNRLTRRTVLRGAGGVAIGLPFLSAMLPPNVTHAQNAAPTRFLVFYSPGGTLLDQWRPMGSETAFEFQSMMAPLTPYRDRLVAVDGLDLSVTEIGVGHPHSRGMAALLTGQQLLPGEFGTNGGNASFADGISVDQVIAEKLSAGLRFKSIEVAACWSTGIAVGGAPHPANILTSAGPKSPIPPRVDPYQTFQALFSDVTGTDPAAAARQGRTRYILDAVMGEYRAISAKLGSEDRAKLDAHLALIADAQERMNASGGPSFSCQPPTDVNSTPGYYDEEVMKDPDGQNTFPGAKVPEKGRIMTDLLVSALACDLTRVGTLQWSDSEANFQLKFLMGPDGAPLADHHHGYQHDRGFQPGALEVIYNWYAQNFAYLLDRMAAVDEGDSTLLDNTVVLWVTEIQQPESHGQSNMPFLLAGGKNVGLRGGRYLKVASQPHNHLLVSVLNLFGIPETRFGHQDFCDGPLAGLA